MMVLCSKCNKEFESILIVQKNRQYYRKMCTSCIYTKQRGLKISKSKKGVSTITEKQRIILRNNCINRIQTTEEKEKRGKTMSQVLKNRKITWADKISKSKLGRKLTNQHKDNISASMKGRQITWKHKISAALTNNVHFKQSCRIAAIKRIERQQLDGQPLFPSIGRNETKILNNIEIENGIKIERQYRCNGYFLDGYDKLNNIAYEIDEQHHYTNDCLSKKDLQRQIEIEMSLNCSFVRIQD